MPALAPATLLDLRDAGARRDDFDRAQLVLEAAWPEQDRTSLARLPIGQRDARLFAVRRATFGVRLPCVVTCPRCGERAEFELGLADLLLAAPDEAPPHAAALGDRRIPFRLATPDDLRWAALEPARARQRLLARCVGEGVELDDEGVEAISAEMARLDPQADVTLTHHCPACGADWETPFDIAAYLWREIEDEAGRILDEVHALARGYGWTEPDVLALPRSRRQAYLQRLGVA